MAKDYALAVAAKPALGQGGFAIVSLAALLATFSAINATIYGLTYYHPTSTINRNFFQSAKWEL
jgi:hypothetical protein